MNFSLESNFERQLDSFEGQLDPYLENQLAALNVDYENATNQKAIMDANYADIEETLGNIYVLFHILMFSYVIFQRLYLFIGLQRLTPLARIFCQNTDSMNLYTSAEYFKGPVPRQVRTSSLIVQLQAVEELQVAIWPIGPR